MEQVLAIADGCDGTQAVSSAAEGYLFSRIDGATSWRLLREIGGIPAGQVDDCLSRWLEGGWVEVVGAAASSPALDAGSVDTDASRIDESALDASLDLDLETQRRILEFESQLDRPYHLLLDVVPSASPKEVKKAYFKLSREFHPDRYFRKELGTFGSRLERIFKKVLEAHEMLLDPAFSQAENGVEGQLVEPAEGAPEAIPQTPRESASAKPQPPSRLERLRQRMPFKVDHGALAARRAQANEIFRGARESQAAGRFQEAEASLRIAIAFDPSRAEFKQALGDVKIASAGARAAELLARPEQLLSERELLGVLSVIGEVLPYRPHDPELNERAARICLRLQRWDEAREHAETLLARQPESAQSHSLLGRVFEAQGRLDRAVDCFERALELGEDDLEARRALAAVRIEARQMARGGATS